MNDLLDSARDAVKKQVHAVAKLLNTLSNGKITPDMITVTGLVAHIGIALLIANESFVLAAVLLIFFGLFDALDGQLARLQNVASKKGMLLDSVTDRLKEVLIYAGLGYSLAQEAQITVWAFLALGFSLTVSYINAWGEVVASSKKDSSHTTNKSFRTGILSFDLRMVAIIFALFTGYVEVTLVVITALALLTIWQRFSNITNRLDV